MVDEGDRTSTIGGSDAAAVAGVSPWKSTYALWAEKVGLVQRDHQSLRMWVGKQLEPLLMDLFEQQTGLRGLADQRRRVHRLYPFIVGHMDGKVVHQPRGIELKTSGTAEGWGDNPVTDGVPLHYYLQVQHYMGITGWEMFYVPVLIGNYRFDVYEVQRNEGAIDALTKLEVDFWRDHVLTSVAPPVDGAESTTAAITAIYRRNTDDLRPATPEETLMVQGLVHARNRLADAQNDVDGRENELRERIGIADGLYGPGFKLTWKATKDTSKVHWDEVAAAYGRLLGDERAEDMAAIVAAHSETKEGSRRLLLTQKEVK